VFQKEWTDLELLSWLYYASFCWNNFWGVWIDDWG